MNINAANLIYFSPTRTTKKILEAIAQSLGVAVVEHGDLTKPDVKPQLQIESKDALNIIGAPVYGGRIPVEAAQRIKVLNGNGAIAVIVVVYGNREYEDALLELSDLAENAGFKTIAGAAFIGEHSFSTTATPIAHGRPDMTDIEKAWEFGRRIREKLRIFQNIDDIPVVAVPGNYPYQEQKRAAKVVPDTKADICSMCKACADVCPTAAISFRDGVITDPASCILCCACVKNCTLGARELADTRVKETIEWLRKHCNERKEPQTYI